MHSNERGLNMKSQACRMVLARWDTPQLSLSSQLVEAWLKTVVRVSVCVRVRLWIRILLKDVARGGAVAPPPPLHDLP